MGRAARIIGVPIITGSAIAVVALLFGGRIDGVVAIGVVFATSVALAKHPLAGYYLILFIAILADLHLYHFSPWTDHLGFYVFQNWWKLLSPAGMRQFGFLVVNTIDVLLLAIAIGLAVRLSRGDQRPFVPPECALVLLYIFAMAGMLGYGLASGGALKPALWQMRPFMYFGVVVCVSLQVLRTRRDVRHALWALVAAAVFKAVQIDWIFFVEERARFGDWREILGHEDSIFFVGVIALTVALALYRAASAQRQFLLLSAPLVLAALIVNLRRASYVALGLSLALLPLLLHGRRRASLKVVAVIIALLGLYAGIYWDRPNNPVALPLQKIKSIMVVDAETVDHASNLYRVAETFNLRRTIAAHPLGLGFGHPFELHIPLPDISFLLPLWRYHPHNMVLGIWLSIGTPGFVVFLSYFAAVIMLASHNVWCHVDGYLKAVSYFLLASLISALLVMAVDQFIWSERGAIFLGAVAGMVSVVHRLRPNGSLASRDEDDAPERSSEL